MKRGDVVLLIMHGEIGKPRPGIVVQSDQLSEAATSILVCPISSDVREPGILRPIVEPDETNSLRVRSQIMTDKLAAVRRDRIRRTIGAVDAQTLERVDRALLFVLGLTA